MSERFEPRIVAFVCTWCTYAGADLAGTSRYVYPPNVRLIRVPCTGRVDASFILKAFESGADGVLVSGCHPGDCHYTSGNLHARRRWNVFRELLRFVGIGDDRLAFSWVSAAEGRKFADLVCDLTERVRAAGPFDGYGRMSYIAEALAAECGQQGPAESPDDRDGREGRA